MIYGPLAFGNSEERRKKLEKGLSFYLLQT